MADGTTRLESGVFYPSTSTNAEGVADPPLPDCTDEKKSGAEAYTGAGGNASGGNVEGEGGLINLFSGA
jgi:hypothetical protein